MSLSRKCDLIKARNLIFRYIIRSSSTITSPSPHVSNRAAEGESLAPTTGSLELHIRRAHYIAMIWRRAAESHPNLPSPAAAAIIVGTSCGRHLFDVSTPSSWSSDKSCKTWMQKGCTEWCNCSKNNISCTEVCRCNKRHNPVEHAPSGGARWGWRYVIIGLQVVDYVHLKCVRTIMTCVALICNFSTDSKDRCFNGQKSWSELYWIYFLSSFLHNCINEYL